ncbi:Carbon-nitrogen hydrolase [Entomophthora muscae]|nr:Carbon-nitrogen hydrolase [Entomophthora muscae]
MMHRISAAQFCATENVSTNLNVLKELAFKAKEENSSAIFFPEASDYIARNHEEASNLAQPLTGSYVSSIQSIARELKIWIGVGVHEKIPESERLYNTYLMISDEGHIREKYQKVHLFDISLRNGPNLKESSYTKAGEKLCPPIPTPFGTIGLAICYDLRFPELSQTLRLNGAQILTYPSVFTTKTGLAHWETLLRARAIETQCFVVAPGQIGNHNSKRSSYGHSMIVSPWGEVLATCGDNLAPSICTSEADMAFLSRVREENAPGISPKAKSVF